MTAQTHNADDLIQRDDAAAAVRSAYATHSAVNDPAIFLHLDDPQNAERAATSGDPAAPLAGMPIAVKDNIDVAGMPTTAACPAFAYTPDEDADVVARLRAAGAIPIGKTNLDQFATGLVGARSPYGVPRNTRDPSLVPGGSSSGSAVAVAHGIVPAALGTDTAGSGRVPAALNGIVGLKPSLGLLSRRGVVPACRTLDTVSVFAHSVAEGYAVMTAAAGYDAADPYSRPFALRPPFAPDRVRLAVPDAASRIFYDAAMEARFDATIDDMAALGIEVTPIDFTPLYAVAELLYDGPWVAERHAVVAGLIARDPDAVLDVIKAVIGKADGQSATDAFRARYRRDELAREIEARLDGLDGLLVPSIPLWPTVRAVADDPIGTNTRLGTYTNFVNLLDMCAVTVPTAGAGDARPGSVTVIARSGADHLAAAVADRIHRAAVPGIPALPAAVDPVPGEMTLVAVGAHMRGLPLNGELTARGARFLQATETAPNYKLFALAGGPPHRPGLVRVDEGGAAIAVEEWAIPDEEFGRFMAGIPAPLGIGTLRLADGRTAKGFVCESAGLDGAADVTAHGGWRAFLAASR